MKAPTSSPPYPTDHPLWEKWQANLDQLDFALQPINHIHQGELFGVEALIRGYQALGFADPFALFDAIYQSGLLYPIDIALRQKALAKFCQLNGHQELKLFYNLDNRVLEATDYQTGITFDLLNAQGLNRHHICFEISERHQLPNAEQAMALLRRYKSQGYGIALDDFGSGYSGLQVMYESEPQFLKIDRFFIAKVFEAPKKKLFLAKIVNLAHLARMQVIAEGVETELEYWVCREVGCDFIQGFLVMKPNLDPQTIARRSPIIAELANADRRGGPTDQRIIGEIERPPSLRIDADMTQVLELFGLHKERTFFPVLDANQRPIGILCERQLKDYVYSPYGRELLKNKSTGKTVAVFVEPCPTADIGSGTEDFLELYAQAEDNAFGVILTEQGRYKGFLSSNKLLQLIQERNLASARDQNPLSGLPGNHRITRFLAKALEGGEPMTLAYFDFDFFKPFNDRMGFRKGDRAILLFAELLSKHLENWASLVGHIGGDDFFAALPKTDYAEVERRISRLRNAFCNDVESFYEDADRMRGYIEAQDREGVQRRFPLLGVSVALLEIPPSSGGFTLERISHATAVLKKKAKESETKIVGAGLIR